MKSETFLCKGDRIGLMVFFHRQINHCFERIPMRLAELSSSFGRKALLGVFLAVPLCSLAVRLAPAHAQSAAESDRKAEPPRVILPLQTGFFNGGKALYITPEVGVDPNAPAGIIAAAQQVAKGFNSNFIPTNFGTLPASPVVDDIFVFTNFAQGNVLASSPHPAGPANIDLNYSPLWQVSLVAWNPGRTARALTSQADIESAAGAGDVTVTKTSIIVECSVIFTPGGGLLPGARLIGDGDDRRDEASSDR
jgi:hypothetical protein